jgi:signal transduction histidine kinase
MTRFVIQCPWCRQKSSFDGDLDEVSIARGEVGQDIVSILTQAEESNRLFLCKNNDCWAPFEAIICEGLELAKDIATALAGRVWFPPRRFRLRADEQGTLHERHFGVLFNRKPLTRRIDIHLSRLVDVDMVAKFLLGITGDRVHPVTLFEAWPVGEDVFWLPVEALTSTPQKGSAGLPRFRPTCIACREVFDEKTKAAFVSDPRIGQPCPHYGNCPANRACEHEDWRTSRINDRCLLWQQYRKKHNPCYSSDVAIIAQTTEGFIERKVTEDAPLKRECWAGYLEIAFPVAVHDHLVGVVMTGQFPSQAAPHSLSEFLEKESEWRRLHPEMDSAPLLPGRETRLREALGSPPTPSAMSSAGANEAQQESLGIAESLQRALTGDVKQLTAVVEDRYLHRRYLSESAFRQEISGTMINALLGGQHMHDILPAVLKRMQEFWAFEHVCCLMGAEWEQNLGLYANDLCFLADEPLSRVEHTVRAESGTRGIHLVPETRNASSPEFDDWLDFLAKVATHCPELAVREYEQFFIVIVQTGRRVYVFVFYGRDGKTVSRAAFRSLLRDAAGHPLPGARLSDECREQVMRTCQVVAERLHHFWNEHDQEQSYRVLSHSLRSPIAQMQRGSGKVRFRLRTIGGAVKNAYPDFYSDLHQLLESLRLGTKVVDGELVKLGAVGNLAEILKRARSGKCDLCEIVRSVEAEYVWRGSTKVAAQTQVLWNFHIPSDASSVVGDKEVIEIVVRNVIDNAFKYSYGGREVMVRVTEERSCMKLSVTNRGVPVAPGEQNRVWDKNYRGVYALKRSVKGEEGTGFGLYLVKMIVQASGGDATLSCKLLCESPRPEGETTVDVTFPKSTT